LARHARIWLVSMERSFTVEAKTFCFSAKDGCSHFRLEERRKGFAGYIFVSNQCALWLMDTVETAVLSQAKEDIAKSYREGDKVTMVHGGGNKAGKYLEVSVYAEGGRKGVIWLPEGRFGRGWRRFAGELRKMAEDQIKKTEKVGSLPGISSERSFADVLRSTNAVEMKASGLKVSSASPLDLFPMQSCFELGSGGEMRPAVDCAAMESLPGSQAAAAAVHASSVKRKGVLGISGLLRYLGLLNNKMDRIIDELGLRPSDRMVRPVCEDGSNVLADPVMCLDMDQGMDPVVMNSGLGSDLAMDLDWALDSDPDILKSSFSLPDSVIGCTRGSVEKVATEDASTRSPVVDSATHVVMAGVGSDGVSEGPGEDFMAVTTVFPAPEVEIPAASREVGISKLGAPIASGIAVGSSDGSEFALEGLSMAEDFVFSTEVALMPENIQTRSFTPVSTMPTVDKAEDSVSQLETPVAPADQCPAVVSAHPMGVGVVPRKEGEPVMTASAKGLLRRGFLGARNDSAPLPEMKEVSSPEKGSKDVAEGTQVCASSKKLAGYARRVKDKFAKEVHKNKDLFNEVVADTSEKGEENYSEVVLDAVKFASNMGWNCGDEGDEKSLLNIFSKIEEERKPTSKVKGKRERKNLECSLNYEARERLSSERCHRRRGCVGTKNACSDPPEVH
jgi:hypothetical protein